MTMEVTAGPDRETPQQQITRIIEKSRLEGPDAGVRLRLPLNIFDPDQNRQYTQIRDAFWNIRLRAATTEVEDVELIIEAITKFTAQLGESGAAEVIKRLETQRAPQ